MNARIHAFGKPTDVLQLDEFELPPLAANELQIEMLAAPINPADLNVIDGTYGNLPEPPATIGNEGCARVTALGSEVTDFAIGDLIANTALGNWCHHRNLPVADAIKLPPGIDPLQAAMLCVNPPTAHAMLHIFVSLEPGDWIIQNAANSGVGRCVIAIAKSLGIKTLNLVRRPELIPELTALGADLVLTDDVDLRKKSPIADTPPRLALNAVGGQSALDIASALAPGGVHVTYGAMSRQPFKAPAGLLIFKDISFQGFWLRRWFEETTAEDRTTTFAELANLVADGTIHVPVAKTFPLEEIQAAIEAATTDSRAGKILLDLKS